MSVHPALVSPPQLALDLAQRHQQLSVKGIIGQSDTRGRRSRRRGSAGARARVERDGEPGGTVLRGLCEKGLGNGDVDSSSSHR